MNKTKKKNRKKVDTVKSVNNSIRTSVRKLNPILKSIVGKKVDDLIKNKKYFILISKIDFGIKTIQEKIVDKQRAENPINEIIYNLFSTDCFFLILFL